MDLEKKNQTRELLLQTLKRKENLNEVKDATEKMRIKIINPDDKQTPLEVVIKKMVILTGEKIQLITNVKNWTVPRWYPCILLGK